MRRMLLALAASLMLLLGCAPARAEKARGIATAEDVAFHIAHLQYHLTDTTCRVTGNYIKVRTEAHADARLAGHLEQADTFVLLALSGDLALIRVLDAHPSSPDSRVGMEGWVSAAYVDCGCSEAEYRANRDPEGVLNDGYFPAGMPSAWYFCSGAGAWATEIAIGEDGSFTGYYHDWDGGSDAAPNGEMQECEFHGQLSAPERISAHEYRMEVVSIAQEGTPGDSFLRDGMLVTISRPYGVGAGDTFIIYLPGTPLNRIPPAYHEWAGVASDDRNTLDFALYNMTDAFGWNKN